MAQGEDSWDMITFPKLIKLKMAKSLLYSNNIDFLVLQMDSDSGWMVVFHQSWYFT